MCCDNCVIMNRFAVKLLLRHSLCLQHTSWSSASQRLSIPTWRTSTWRCNTRAGRPVQRQWSLPTCCVEDARRKDNTVLDPGHGIVLRCRVQWLNKWFCGFCSARFESSRDDCPATKHNPKCKGHFLKGQPASFGRLPVASWCTHTMKILCIMYLYFIIYIKNALCA